ALECTADGGGTRCDVVAGMPQAEQCNGIDDDCDFAADEDWRTGECGQGVCARPLIRCPGDPAPVCDPFQGAGAELCDSLDNDCDGTLDEDPEDAGAGCPVGVGACERGGVETCIDGELLCIGDAGPPQDEVCNDIDDDCDGLLDEGLNCPGGEALALIDYTYESDAQAMAVLRVPLLTGGWQVEIGTMRLVQAPNTAIAWQVNSNCELQPVPGPSVVLAIGDRRVPIHLTAAPSDCPVRRPAAPDPTWPDASVVYGPAPTRAIDVHWPDGRVVEIHDRAVQPTTVEIIRDTRQRIIRVDTPAARIHYRWTDDGTPQVDIEPVQSAD
ncbi:MAG: hypothetical protein ACI9U2_004952, partial [Bradymonadia bacterium]